MALMVSRVSQAHIDHNQPAGSNNNNNNNLWGETHERLFRLFHNKSIFIWHCVFSALCFSCVPKWTAAPLQADAWPRPRTADLPVPRPQLLMSLLVKVRMSRFSNYGTGKIVIYIHVYMVCMKERFYRFTARYIN